jgi:1,2-diacylglycerol 3-beta-galactosyltransferase
MTKLQIVYFDAGGGHRSAAQALAEVLVRQRRPWDVQLVNLDSLLEPIDFIYRATGVRSFEFYNWSLRMGWTSLPSRLLPASRSVIRLLHERQVELLHDYWARTKPDLVVSVVPHFGRAIFEGLRESCPRAQLVTILTDLVDTPPHFWFERQNQHFICGSAKAIEQARQNGAPESRIWRVSGMIVHPKFYDPATVARRTGRGRLGLSPDLPTALVLFGGYGSPDMVTIVEQLRESKLAVQSILLCGRNERLLRRLSKMRTPFPKVALGFTSDVAAYMRLSDIFIGKPGPGSVSEALATGLPVIVERSSRTMVQERYNVDWIEEQKVGLGIRSFSGISGALEYVLRPGVYAELCANIGRLRNTAVFEIPPILEQILGAPAVGPHTAQWACPEQIVSDLF